MGILVKILELVGTVAFAISGAMLACKKNMDLLGVCVLGLTTACGGGVLRDLMLGRIPPTMFLDPVYALTALGVSLVIFLPALRRRLLHNHRLYDLVMLLADSAGLGLFTVAAVNIVVQAGYGDNYFFCVFLGTLTACGGGVIRDVMAGMPPYIFVKHIYACASLLGALVCTLLWDVTGRTVAMTIGAVLVFAIRLLAAHFRWSLPKSGVVE